MNSPDWIFRDERLSDNLYNGYGNDDVRIIGNGQANASTGLFNTYWGDLYAGIKTTHTFLANVDRVPEHERRAQDTYEGRGAFCPRLSVLPAHQLVWQRAVLYRGYRPPHGKNNIAYTASDYRRMDPPGAGRDCRNIAHTRAVYCMPTAAELPVVQPWPSTPA